MYPTAISQVIESVGKLVFGLVLSFGVIKYADIQIAQTGSVFGQIIENEEDKAIVYALAAAAAILGVTLGTVFGALYTVMRHKLKKDGITEEMLVNSPLASPKKDTIKEILSILSEVRIDRTSNTSTKGGLEVVINHRTGVMYELSITETIISIDGTCHKANKDCYGALKPYLLAK
jgi:stage V sporulation protein B